MTDPSYSAEDHHGSSSGDEPTRVMPVDQRSASVPAPTARRSQGRWTAAVLTGALVVGGAAGFGGAAAYDAVGQTSSGATQPTASNHAPYGGSGSGAVGTGASSSSGGVAPTGSGVQQVAARLMPSVVQINVSGPGGSGSGSGIILSSSGLLLTNNHVVALAGNHGSIAVSLHTGRTVKAHVIGTDPVTDLAVIQAQGVHGLTPARLGSSNNLKVGQTVVAIGSPYGLSSTVTTGIVSALNRAVSVSESSSQPNPFDPFAAQQSQSSLSTTYPAIQTDAAINPGNSGGPLVNLQGQVVGINSSIYSTSSSSTSQSGSIGLGFAIPIDEAIPIIDQLRQHQTPTHARMGVTVSSSTKELQPGAVVRSVESGGAAAAAGLRPGDVITRVDGDLIQTSDDLVATIRGHRPGQRVRLSLLRNGHPLRIWITLGSDANTQSS